VPYRVNRRCSSGLRSARAFSGMPVTSNSVFPALPPEDPDWVPQST
jgi:hypothetical protein